MLSRYQGTCAYCHKPTVAHVDRYSVEERISYHESCRMGLKPQDGTDETAALAKAIAEKLGYK